MSQAVVLKWDGSVFTLRDSGGTQVYTDAELQLLEDGGTLLLPSAPLHFPVVPEGPSAREEAVSVLLEKNQGLQDRIKQLEHEVALRDARLEELNGIKMQLLERLSGVVDKVLDGAKEERLAVAAGHNRSPSHTAGRKRTPAG